MADFFNKVIAGINSGVNSVSENSKLFMEKTRLNAAIKEKNDKMNKLSQQIGITAYQMIKNGELSCSQFDELCTEIDICNSEIEELNVQLLNLQNVSDTSINTSIQCKCGYFNKSDALFCANCGTKLKKEED